MAKDKLTDYDSTASNNLDIGGISIAEGMLPSNVNNALREQMSHLADAFGAGTPLYVDQTNNRVGIGATSPSFPLDVSGSDFVGIHYERSGTNSPALKLSNGTTGDLIQIEGSNSGDFIFKNGAGTLSEAMRIKSSGEIDVSGDGGGSQLNNVFNNDGTAGNDNVVIRAKIGGTTARSMIQFGDADDTNVGQIDYDHDDDAMKFTVNTSEAIRLDSDGLKFNGDTSADNALDDYEQGSWTVDLQDSSGNSATGINGNGRYIKVGNLVTVWGRLSDPDLTGLTSGDDVRIYGLPFTASNFTGDAINFMGSVKMENVAFSSNPDGYVNTNIIEGGTFIRLAETRNNAVDDNIVVSQLGATSEMYFTATYPTTAF